MQETGDMDDVSIVILTNNTAHRARTTYEAPVNARRLGPNQLNWLRLNIDSFRWAENQQALLQRDAVRAARIAGLI
jgi:hypothetical protein